LQNLGLDKIGITSWTELLRNPSYDVLFEHETDPGLEDHERGVVTESGAVAVDTGRFTGRSPKDKYFVVEDTSKDHLWWACPEYPTSDNKPISEATWRHLHELARNRLNGKRLYVVDGFCGTNPETRLSVRFVTEVSWMAHFCRNMFLWPTDDELADFVPDWNVLHACKTTCEDFAEHGLRSEVFSAGNIKERMSVIGGSWYPGEIKKGIFTLMNYFLPLAGVGAFHCSANMAEDGDTALFFGLSGTGKTTLSADPHRRLIGDDEHGWDDEGVFNFENGCYAKTIDLSRESEPDIYDAIRRDALIENMVIDADGRIDFSDRSKTENTRVSYPIWHINNIVRPVSRGGHPSKIVFLACDAFGVLPPVAKLDYDQAMYQYLSGYTAKVAGTELGIVEPVAAFSACFGAAFLCLHPTAYSEVLGQKMRQHGSDAYLVNSGWTGGGYGTGHRMSIKNTRAVIDAILDGTLDDAEFDTMPIFNLKVPRSVRGVDSAVLNARNTWPDKAAYDATVRKLAGMFVENFKTFTDTPEGQRLELAGPQL